MNYIQVFSFIGLLSLYVGIGVLWNSDSIFSNNSPSQMAKSINSINESVSPDRLSFLSPTPAEVVIPAAYEIPSAGQVYQTFNNCGPASLSMLLGYYQLQINQKDIGDDLRPYQNPSGDNDDKSVSFEEFGDYIEGLGLVSYHRPYGDINLLKRLISAGYPVLVRTWLHPGEDIGHFRIVRGYDDYRAQLLQDDSYQGPNRTYSYETFMEMWRPFQYEFFVIAKHDDKDQLAHILGEYDDTQAVWQKMRADSQKAPVDGYAIFNQSVAAYYVGDYESATRLFEESRSLLPGRMLWYQIEPILAYKKLGNKQAVWNLTDSILLNHNRAFSELYMIRGEMLEAEGDYAGASNEYELAVRYNRNWQLAQEALSRVNDK